MQRRFLLLHSHSQQHVLETCWEAALLGASAVWHNCISGNTDANESTHHACKDVAHYFNKYTEWVIFSSMCHNVYELVSRKNVLLQQPDGLIHVQLLLCCFAQEQTTCHLQDALSSAVLSCLFLYMRDLQIILEFSQVSGYMDYVYTREFSLLLITTFSKLGRLAIEDFIQPLILSLGSLWQIPSCIFR